VWSFRTLGSARVTWGNRCSYLNRPASAPLAKHPDMNAIHIIAPYRHLGMWVFDDARVGLTQEPFVSGADIIIDELVRDIPNAEKGFRLLFSPTPFPGRTLHIQWVREEHGGNWYRWEDRQMDGWLCPALFRYFTEAPRDIYAQALPANE
jgi:hypothetical protein